MASVGHRSILILICMVAASLSFVPAGARTNGDEGCINLEYANWGGPLSVRPYFEGGYGVVVTDDDPGTEGTYAFFVIPELCGPQQTVTDPLDTAIRSSSNVLPGSLPVDHAAPSDPGLPLLP